MVKKKPKVLAERKEEKAKIEEKKLEEKKEEAEEIKQEEKLQGGKGVKLNAFEIFGIALAILLLVVAAISVFKKQEELLNVNYSLQLEDGTVVSGGTEKIEEGTLISKLGVLSGKADDALKQMKVGEEKTITLGAEEAFGEYDESKIYVFNRTRPFAKRNFELEKEEFAQYYGEEPLINKTYDTSFKDIKLKILAKNEKNVTGFLIAENKTYEEQGGKQEIIVTEDEIFLRVTPEIGLVATLEGEKCAVKNVNETSIFFDCNRDYAGKKIFVKITLLGKEKVEKQEEKISGSTGEKIAGAPTMQVFIMSHCPYGTQMVKGILPVWETFKNKANIELRFVSYTMHGAQEDLDNNRIMCIREEQSDKLLKYLECFVSNTGSEADSQKCISQTGVDTSKLDSCMSSRVSKYYDVDKQLNTQYNVQGSPTVIIDGKEASIYPRDPQTVANALCDAFTTKPEECSTKFSEENPSPGFGSASSSGSSGSSGSCS